MTATQFDRIIVNQHESRHRLEAMHDNISKAESDNEVRCLLVKQSPSAQACSTMLRKDVMPTPWTRLQSFCRLAY